MFYRTVKRRPAAFVFAAMAAFFTLAMLVARETAMRGMVYPFTVFASLGFVATAVAGGACRHSYGRLMVVALVACCTGDLVGPYHFVAGAIAFLLAHGVFIMAYLTQGLQWRNMVSPLAGILIAGVLLLLWLLPHVPESEILLVTAYMVVISTMVVVAFGTKLRHGWGLLVTGATLFFISDIFVARWKYVSPESINALLCYPLYYMACILLALSVACLTVSSESYTSENRD